MDLRHSPALNQQSSLKSAEEAVDRFERAWQSGSRPSIHLYCDAVEPTRSALLLELTLIDLEYRFRSGEQPRIEEYLTRFPELKQDDRALLDLLAAERRWRDRKNPSHAGGPSDSENLAAFRVLWEHAMDDIASARPSANKRDAGRSQPNGAGVTSAHPNSAAANNADANGADLNNGDAGSELGTLPTAHRSHADDASEISTAPRSSPTSMEGTVVGRFRLLERLGAGSFGTVYRAADLMLDRFVAIKIPHREVVGTADDRERVLREARSAAQLRHPHIVPVYEVSLDEGRPYIVAALVTGQTLAATLATRRFQPREAAEIVATLAETLQFAHEHRVIHRDVKPSNIMIEASGSPVVMDFGLSKREGIDTSLTQEGQLVGTPAYMSPEQAQGEVNRIDARSDIYSLGVVLYEMLTGERPFRGKLEVLIPQVVNDEPRSPRALIKQTPRDLATIVLKCLEKSQASRYASAAELAADLRRFLGGEPIRARPVPLWEREWRRARRRPWTSALLAAVACLLVTVAIVSTVAALRKIEAVRATEDSLVRLERLHLDRGNAAVDKGNPAESLAWFAKAWSLRPADAERDAVYRPRVATTARQLPKITQIWHCTGGVNLLRISPDGRKIAVASSNRVAVLYDLADPAAVQTLPQPGSVMQCEFDPAGQRVAIVSYDGKLQLRQVNAEGPPTILFHWKPVTWVAFSADGRLIATGCQDGAARLWDAATGKPVSQPLRHSGVIRNVAFSPDGAWLATASEDKTARVWPTAGNGEPGPPLVHNDAVNRVCFSTDGKRLFTASDDHTARIWDAASGSELFSLKHDSQVERVIYADHLDLLITASAKGTVRVWDATRGSATHNLSGHENKVLDLSLSNDGRWLATASEDKTARVWDLETGTLGFPILGHVNGVASAVFSPDSRQLITGCYDGTTRVWELNAASEWEVPTGEPARAAVFVPATRLLLVHSVSGVAHVCSLTSKEVHPLANNQSVLAAAIAPGGGLAATLDQHNRVELWDLAAWRLLRSTSVDANAGTAAQSAKSGLYFSPRGDKLLIARNDAAWIWNVTSDASPLTVPLGTNLLNAAFDTTGQLLYTVGEDRIVQIWDAATGRRRGQISVKDGQNKKFFFAADASQMVRTGPYGNAEIWDLAAGTKHQPLPKSLSLVHAAFSPDNRLLAGGTSTNSARVWDCTIGVAVTPPLVHRRDVVWCAFSDDGKLVATASKDATARVWEAETGMPVSPYLGHHAPALFLAFDESVNQLVSVCEKGIVRGWNLGNEALTVDEATRLARAYSGFEVNEEAELVPIGGDVLESEWQARATQPPASGGH